MQERHETSRTTKLIAHEDSNHFVLNTHALHNAHLLRRVLPRELVAPKPLYEDWTARHYEIAESLRVTQSEKRARTAAKRKATVDAKKKKNQALLGDSDAPESEEENIDPDEEMGQASSSRKRHRAHNWALFLRIYQQPILLRMTLIRHHHLPIYLSCIGFFYVDDLVTNSRKRHRVID